MSIGIAVRYEGRYYGYAIAIPKNDTAGGAFGKIEHPKWFESEENAIDWLQDKVGGWDYRTFPKGFDITDPVKAANLWGHAERVVALEPNGWSTFYQSSRSADPAMNRGCGELALVLRMDGIRYSEHCVSAYPQYCGYVVDVMDADRIRAVVLENLFWIRHPDGVLETVRYRLTEADISRAIERFVAVIAGDRTKDWWTANKSWLVTPNQTKAEQAALLTAEYHRQLPQIAAHAAIQLEEYRAIVASRIGDSHAI
jgi:hypothetical protein